MSGSRTKAFRDCLAGLGLTAHAGLLAAVLITAWLATAPVAFALSGSTGLIASAIGALVCLAGAELALMLSAPLQGPNAAMYALAIGMLARTVVPMVIGVALHLTVPMLANAGMIFYLLGFYMVALAAETALVVARVPSNTSGKAV